MSFDPISYAMGAKGGGGGASALVVTATEEQTGEFETTYTADKTAGEIIDAMPLVFFKDEHEADGEYYFEYRLVPGYWISEGEYNFSLENLKTYTAATLNDYPVCVDRGK